MDEERQAEDPNIFVVSRWVCKDCNKEFQTEQEARDHRSMHISLDQVALVGIGELFCMPPGVPASVTIQLPGGKLHEYRWTYGPIEPIVTERRADGAA